MRLLNIWVKLLSTTIQVAFIQLQLLNQRILFRLDEWFKTYKEWNKTQSVSSKEISALDEFDEYGNALNTSNTEPEPETETENDKYKPYDGPVSMTP